MDSRSQVRLPELDVAFAGQSLERSWLRAYLLFAEWHGGRIFELGNFVVEALEEAGDVDLLESRGADGAAAMISGVEAEARSGLGSPADAPGTPSWSW